MMIKNHKRLKNASVILAFFLLTGCSKREHSHTYKNVEFVFSQSEIGSGESFKIGKVNTVHTSNFQDIEKAYYIKSDTLFIPSSKITLNQIGSKKLETKIDPFYMAIALVSGLKEFDLDVEIHSSLYDLHTKGLVRLESKVCDIDFRGYDNIELYEFEACRY